MSRVVALQGPWDIDRCGGGDAVDAKQMRLALRMSLGKKGGRSICPVPGVEIEWKTDEEWKHMSLETETEMISRRTPLSQKRFHHVII